MRRENMTQLKKLWCKVFQQLLHSFSLSLSLSLDNVDIQVLFWSRPLSFEKCHNMCRRKFQSIAGEMNKCNLSAERRRNVVPFWLIETFVWAAEGNPTRLKIHLECWRLKIHLECVSGNRVLKAHLVKCFSVGACPNLTCPTIQSRSTGRRTART